MRLLLHVGLLVLEGLLGLLVHVGLLGLALPVHVVLLGLLVHAGLLVHVRSTGAACACGAAGA